MASDLKTIPSASDKRLTGKQSAFIHAYLGEARFNATAAAKIAGYRATSQHSFEAIGAENLLRPAIRAVIDEHWKLSRMSAEECLGELTKLARGNGKDQIRALALLSQHHGLLDGKWNGNGKDPVTLRVIYDEKIKWEKEVDVWKTDIEKEINELNDKGLKIYNAAREKFAHSPDVKAFCEVYEKMLNGDRKPSADSTDLMMPTEKPVEVEIIPPQRRLQPAQVERMMADVEEQSVRAHSILTSEQTPTTHDLINTDEYPNAHTLCDHEHQSGICPVCHNTSITLNERGERVFTFGQAARPRNRRILYG